MTPRWCKRCKRIKHVTDFRLRYRENSKGECYSRANVCRDCTRKQDRERMAKRRARGHRSTDKNAAKRVSEWYHANIQQARDYHNKYYHERRRPVEMKGALRALQKDVGKWSAEQFGEEDPAILKLLGAVEEIGELCHAELKGIQNIRHSPDEILALKKDAIGDVVVYLCDYCERSGIDFGNAVIDTWHKVKDRKWKDDPINADKARCLNCEGRLTVTGRCLTCNPLPKDKP